jgi:DNA-binding transcriptional LysR family regulator
MKGMEMIGEIRGDFFQWLRGFYYVVKNQSVTQACIEMGRNQSTISHQIKSLENEFGIILFDRSGGKMELTPEGKLFLEKTISVFEIIKGMRNELSSSFLENKGKINIAASYSIIHYFLPDYIMRFRKKSPAVTFELEGGGLEMVIDRVESAEADFGIVSVRKLPEGLITHSLFETGMTLLACRNNPFFSGPDPTLEQIANIPFISIPLHTTAMDDVERVFRKNNLKLNPVIVLDNYASIKIYVEEGIGISILDSFTLTKDDRLRFDLYPMDRYFESRKYLIIMRNQKYISPQTRAFLKSIKPEMEFPDSNVAI